jgi:hypothetical protein
VPGREGRFTRARSRGLRKQHGRVVPARSHPVLHESPHLEEWTELARFPWRADFYHAAPAVRLSGPARRGCDSRTLAGNKDRTSLTGVVRPVYVRLRPCPSTPPRRHRRARAGSWGIRTGGRCFLDQSRQGSLERLPGPPWCALAVTLEIRAALLRRWGNDTGRVEVRGREVEQDAPARPRGGR